MPIKLPSQSASVDEVGYEVVRIYSSPSALRSEIKRQRVMRDRLDFNVL